MNFRTAVLYSLWCSRWMLDWGTGCMMLMFMAESSGSRHREQTDTAPRHPAVPALIPATAAAALPLPSLPRPPNQSWRGAILATLSARGLLPVTAPDTSWSDVSVKEMSHVLSFTFWRYSRSMSYTCYYMKLCSFTQNVIIRPIMMYT